jgi:hypothetical protein
MQVTAKQWDTIRPYITVAVEAAAVDPELRGLVDQWMDEAIADVEEGLQQAGRFDPETRHLRARTVVSARPDRGRWRPQPRPVRSPRSATDRGSTGRWARRGRVRRR